MTHVWFDELGRAHRSSVAAEVVDDALRSIEDALELVEAISVHEKLVALAELSRERLDDLLLRGGYMEEPRTD
jgi:hypothetical protein